MPARAMTYKFFNTFIDDLFAWTIKMPFLHRLATLRDDLIFFVYLYQAWAYKVDYTRVNEFGQGGDEEGTEEKVAGQPLKAPPGQSADESKKGLKEIKDAVAGADDKVDRAVSSGAQKGGAKRRKA